MRILQYGIVLTLLIFFAHCAKDETPSPEQEPDTEVQDKEETPEPEGMPDPGTEIYFQAFIGDNLSTHISDNFLLIHDIEGNLIDYKPFEKLDTLNFEISKADDLDKFTVTYFEVFTLTGRAPFTLKSYTEVSRGSSWIIGDLNADPIDYSEAEVIGSFDLRISGDLPVPTRQLISNRNGDGDGGRKRITTYSDTQKWLYEKEVDLFEANDYYITLLNGFGDTSYHYLEDMQDQMGYNLLDFQFSEFDSHINMEFLNNSFVSLFLIGYPETYTRLPSPGYHFYSLGRLVAGEDISQNYALGYLGNTFEAHWLHFSCILDDYEYLVSYNGDQLPEDLIVPEKPAFNVVNPDIREFQMSTDVNYERRNIIWSSMDPSNPDKRETNWELYSSPTSSATIGSIPEEITDMYPEMNISELKPYFGFLFAESYTYDEFLEAEFSGNRDAISIESYIRFSFDLQ